VKVETVVVVPVVYVVVPVDVVLETDVEELAVELEVSRRWKRWLTRLECSWEE